MTNKCSTMGAVFIAAFILIVLLIPLISVSAPSVAIAGISPVASLKSQQ
ncbi:hypothetical protein [Oryzifoliimicrobium ureilyticus]